MSNFVIYAFKSNVKLFKTLTDLDSHSDPKYQYNSIHRNVLAGCISYKCHHERNTSNKTQLKWKKWNREQA